MTSVPHNQPANELQVDRLWSARYMAVLMVTSLSMCLILVSMTPWTSVGLIVLAAIIIAKRSPMCVVAILAVCLGDRLYWAWRFGVWRMHLGADELLLAVSIVGFVASSLRYISLDPKRFRWQPDEQARSASEERAAPTLRPFSLSLLRLPAAIVLAWMVLVVFSRRMFWPNRFAFDPAVLRMIVLVWTLAMIFVIPTAIVSVIRWRAISATQAALYLRRELARGARREQRHIERAIARRRLKLTQTRSNEDVDGDS